MEIVSRAAARLAGASRYFTGKPCLRGHVAERVTANATCVDCYVVAHRERYHADPLRLEKRKAGYQRNREKILAAQKEYAARKSDQIRARKAEYTRANRESLSATHRRWRNGPGRHKAAAVQNERRHRHRRQTPPWVDRNACRVFYEIASRASRCTGIPFEVDHVIPLAGKAVSGLHVPWNLAVIPAYQNRKKGNRLPLVDWL